MESRLKRKGEIKHAEIRWIYFDGAAAAGMCTDVPMRVTGAVLSIVPVVGNTAHDGIDEAADIVDEVPL